MFFHTVKNCTANCTASEPYSSTTSPSYKLTPGYTVLPFICRAVIQTEFRKSPDPSTDIAMGDTAILRCRPPGGDPEPRVRWRKDGSPFRPAPSAGGGGGERVWVDEGGSLHVAEARREDSGAYVCVGYNLAGERDSPPALLNVRGIRGVFL